MTGPLSAWVRAPIGKAKPSTPQRALSGPYSLTFLPTGYYRRQLKRQQDLDLALLTPGAHVL